MTRPKKKVIVIGAGPCGLFTASKLQQKGHDVTVISSSQKMEFGQKSYQDWLQHPGLGGRGQVWGGSLDFPTASEFKAEAWPLSYARLKKEEPEVRAWLEAEEHKEINPELKKHGYAPKVQSMKNFSGPWPFKIQKSTHALELVEKNGVIIGLDTINQKTGKKKLLVGSEFYLCASPFSSLKLLQGLERCSSSLGEGMTNHMVAGLIGLCPNESVEDKRCTRSFKKTEFGLVEFKGPFPGIELNKEWKDYSYYSLHYMGVIAPRKGQMIDWKKGKIHLSFNWNRKEMLQAKLMEKKLNEELAILQLKKLTKVSPKKTLNFANIAHESGGACLGKVVDKKARLKNYKNLFVLDASIMPTGLQTYPTLPLLCLISSMLR